MIIDTLREKLAAEPFRPFIVRSSSGEGYRVSSPDLVVLMKSSVFIAQPTSDRATTVPYLHVAAVEELGETHKARRPRRRAG
jgi:hypothetical protein